MILILTDLLNIVAIEKKGQYYTTLGLDELAEQFSGMLKKEIQ
jgi:hypothetical protein